jgi:hypothetical protein
MPYPRGGRAAACDTSPSSASTLTSWLPFNLL